MIHDFIVIGAGASGLFFAATRGRELDGLYTGLGGMSKPGAASGKRLEQPANVSNAGSDADRAAKVLILERQDRAGRKLLLSGGGKCNVTNLSVTPENYLCASPRFCRHALSAFEPERMLALLRQNRIDIEEREHGQIFCRRGAEELRDLLLALAVANSASLLTGQRIESVRSLECGWEFIPGNGPEQWNGTRAKTSMNDQTCGESLAGWRKRSELTDAHGDQSPRFEVRSNGRAHFARNLLVASGNKAWPRSGATVFGLELAGAAGHSLIALRPGLTPLKMPPDWPLHGLQGLSVTASVSVVSAVDGKKRGGPAFTLPLLFTHQGLSGPACLQASSYLEKGYCLEIDFLPGQDLETLLDDPANGKASLQSLLRARLPERLAEALLRASGLDGLKARRVAELSRAARRQAADGVHRHTAKAEQPGFGQSESTVGGVNTAEINSKNMESRLCPGLYFCGEALDVCGQLGGYNLHWAWASAWLAGRG